MQFYFTSMEISRLKFMNKALTICRLVDSKLSFIYKNRNQLLKVVSLCSQTENN